MMMITPYKCGYASKTILGANHPQKLGSRIWGIAPLPQILATVVSYFISQKNITLNSFRTSGLF